MGKVAIFPAAGALGGGIYKHLFKLLPPTDLILICRNPGKIPSEYLTAGVTTRKADYDTPESLEHVFDGATCLVLISYPSIEHEHRFKAHKLAIDAARRSSPGISHIFYTSLAFGGDCTPESVAHVMQAHLSTEKYLTSLSSSLDSPSSAQSDAKPFKFTVIREGIYSKSFPLYTGFFNLKQPANEVRIPHDGSGPGIAWAKTEELAEASAQLVKNYLNEPESFPYINKIMVLSGSRAWTLGETVKLLGDVVGKQVKLIQVPFKEHAENPVVKETMSSDGPGDAANEWTTVFEAIRRGETAVVSSELRNLLGREPESFEKTVRAIFHG